MDTGVYIHIPFCRSRCPYCDFNTGVPERIPEVEYVDALSREFRCHTENTAFGGRRLASIYFGGGTPSLLSPHSVEGLVELIRGGFSASGDLEVTIEANPGSIDAKKARDFLRAGINRIIIGVQSFSDAVLKRLGRGHSAADAMRAFDAVMEAGFDNAGLDLIFAVPGQSLSAWMDSVERAVCLGPEHVSIYNLTIEEATPFGRLFREGFLLPPDDDETIEMFFQSVERLKSAGYYHYEISNLSLPGRHSVHNTNYWLGKDYIGLGAGAHSFFSGIRRWNEREVSVYMEMVRKCGHAAAGSERLSDREAETEAVMLGLRMVERGIEAGDFSARFGSMRWQALRERARTLALEGLVSDDGKRIVLTRRGLALADGVAAALAPVAGLDIGPCR